MKIKAVDPIHLDTLFKRIRITFDMVIVSSMALLIGFGAAYFYKGFQSDHLSRSLEKEIMYTKQASQIVDYYYRDGTCIRFQVAEEMIKAVDICLPQYFPKGPYTRKDFIALALTETPNLDQYAVGTSGERGLFQIMNNMCNAFGITANHFDIRVNTELAMLVLRDKFEEHKDYRKALIAYNGLVIKNGRLSDKYWRRFSKYRKDVEIILGE